MFSGRTVPGPASVYTSLRSTSNSTRTRHVSHVRSANANPKNMTKSSHLKALALGIFKQHSRLGAILYFWVSVCSYSKLSPKSVSGPDSVSVCTRVGPTSDTANFNRIL